MNLNKLVRKLFILMLALPWLATAAEFKPAVVYDKVGKFDKSFNEAVYRNGVQKFLKDKGVEVFELEPQFRIHRDKGLKKLASEGYSPIVTVGFSFAQIVEETAKEYPNANFVIVDAVVNLPNVQSILFAEHEGSFLVGALAALKTKSDTLGFVGGMDIPLISKFGCGFIQGARYINPNVQVHQVMTGPTPAAFRNPEKGAKLAMQQIDQGADVIFAAAGETGIGVFTAAKYKGALAIGVDSNQNWMRPGIILTSMVKHVGFAAYKAWEQALEGNWRPGITVLDLGEGGVDWALDEYNRKLVSDDMESQIEAIKREIIRGNIRVHNYMENNNCPIS